MRKTQKLQALGLKDKIVERALDELAVALAAAFFVALLLATYGLDLSPGLF